MKDSVVSDDDKNHATDVAPLKKKAMEFKKQKIVEKINAKTYMA